MTTNQATTAITALRIFHGKSPKVHVYENGTEIAALGGARAARAEAVIVTQWSQGGKVHFELRGSASAAATEAARNSRARTMRHGGASFDIDAAASSVAVEVGELVITEG